MTFINKIKTFHLQLISHLAFILLVIFAFYFYQERTLFIDSAYQLFNIIAFEEYMIPAYRYGVIIPQTPVLIFSMLGADIKSVLILFSTSYILLYYSIFIICLHLLKHKGSALLILLSLVTCTSLSFYHPVTETHQSLVYSCLLWAWLDRGLNFSEWKFFLVLLIVFSLCFFTHPVSVFPVGFLVARFLSRNKFQRSSLVILLLFFLPYIIKVIVTPADTYEGELFDQLTNFRELIFNFNNLYSTNFLFDKFFWDVYWIPCLAMLLGIIILSLKKKWMELALYFGFTCSFIIITCIIYHKGESNIMMEKNFMPLATLVFFPVLNQEILKNRKLIVSLLLVLLMCFSLNRIIDSGNSIQNRLAFLTKLLGKTSEQLNYIDLKELDGNKIKIHWAVPMETALLSASQGNLKTIYISNDLEKSGIDLSVKETMLGPKFQQYVPFDNLNKNYFNFTSSGYVKLELE